MGAILLSPYHAHQRQAVMSVSTSATACWRTRLLPGSSAGAALLRSGREGSRLLAHEVHEIAECELNVI
jgi:hypothetical protein